MRLLRPYPDELLGSLLHRATRQMGISAKQLMPRLSGTTNKAIPMLITRHAGFAHAFGMTLDEFVQNHSLLPYTVAFMSPEARARTIGALLSDDKASISTAAQNAIKGSRWLRFCPACRIEDQHQYGDTYWHRMHQLPGVLVCATHHCGLFVSTVSVRATTAMVPPVEAQGDKVPSDLLPTRVSLEIADMSRAALHVTLPIQDWTKYYRRRAADIGYTKNGGDVFGSVVCDDLRTFYCEPYLKSIGLEYASGDRSKWPAMMFQSHFSNSTSVKHILLNVFLDSAPQPSKTPQEAGGKWRRPRRNWAEIEITLLHRFEEEASKLRQTGARITLQDLYEKIDAARALHHNRHKMPRVLEWLETFKASPNAERQTGRRPRASKK